MKQQHALNSKKRVDIKYSGCTLKSSLGVGNTEQLGVSVLTRDM